MPAPPPPKSSSWVAPPPPSRGSASTQATALVPLAESIKLKHEEDLRYIWLERAKKIEDQGWYTGGDRYLINWFVAARTSSDHFGGHKKSQEQVFEAVLKCLLNAGLLQALADHPLIRFMMRFIDIKHWYNTRSFMDETSISAVYLHVVTTNGTRIVRGTDVGQFTKEIPSPEQYNSSFAHAFVLLRNSLKEEYGISPDNAAILEYSQIYLMASPPQTKEEREFNSQFCFSLHQFVLLDSEKIESAGPIEYFGPHKAPSTDGNWHRMIVAGEEIQKHKDTWMQEPGANKYPFVEEKISDLVNGHHLRHVHPYYPNRYEWSGDTTLCSTP